MSAAMADCFGLPAPASASLGPSPPFAHTRSSSSDLSVPTPPSPLSLPFLDAPAPDAYGADALGAGAYSHYSPAGEPLFPVLQSAFVGAEMGACEEEKAAMGAHADWEMMASMDMAV